MKYSKAVMDKKLKELNLIGKKVSELNEQNNALELTTDALRADVNAFKDKKLKADGIIEGLNSDIKEKREEFDKLTFELNETAEELAELKTGRDELSAEYNILSGKIEDANNKLAKAASEVSDLENRKKEIEEKIDLGMDNLNDFKEALEMKEAILNKRESVLVNKEKLK